MGSQMMTVPDLSQPRPTFNMGREEGSILLLIQREEIRTYILLGLEEPKKHSGNVRHVPIT